MMFYHLEEKATTQSMVRQTVNKWRKFRIVATFTRANPRSQTANLKDVRKNPGVTSKDLQKTLQTAKTFVHVSTIRKH